MEQNLQTKFMKIKVVIEETYGIPEYMTCGCSTLEEMLEQWFSEYSLNMHHASRDESLVSRKFICIKIDEGEKEVDSITGVKGRVYIKKEYIKALARHMSDEQAQMSWKDLVARINLEKKFQKRKKELNAGFRQEYLQKCTGDKEFEDYLNRWVGYHRDVKQLGAVHALHKNELYNLSHDRDSETYKKFECANIEALRIIEEENGGK